MVVSWEQLQRCSSHVRFSVWPNVSRSPSEMPWRMSVQSACIESPILPKLLLLKALYKNVISKPQLLVLDKLIFIHMNKTQRPVIGGILPQMTWNSTGIIPLPSGTSLYLVSYLFKDRLAACWHA